jgi:hypothetical protein
MKGSGSVPRLSKSDLPLILFTGLQHIGRGPPIPFGYLRKGPRVAFSAREVTTRLIDREVVFRPRKVNSRDQPKGAVVHLFEGGFAGQRFSSLGLRITTPLGISLFNQIAFHLKILSQPISPLQEKSGLWYMKY